MSKELTKLEAARALTKAVDTMMDKLVKLKADIEMLKAQGPIIVPPTSYRVVDKWHDDDGAFIEKHHGSMNGRHVDLDALARDAQRHAVTPDRIR